MGCESAAPRAVQVPLVTSMRDQRSATCTRSAAERKIAPSTSWRSNRIPCGRRSATGACRARHDTTVARVAGASSRDHAAGGTRFAVPAGQTICQATGPNVLGGARGIGGAIAVVGSCASVDENRPQSHSNAAAVPIVAPASVGDLLANAARHPKASFFRSVARSDAW